MAEIAGKATGYNRGKGGTLHLTVRELGFLSTSALVGGTLPLAIGAAFAAKRRGSDAVNVCFFGDGALEEGVFYEAINIAALWSLPVVYLCENNSLGALGQKAGEYPGSTIAARDLTDLAKAFGVPALSVEGTDAGAVHAAMQQALQRARAGGGPTFIEARTVRWPGTSLLWPELVTGVMRLEYAWDAGSIPAEYAVWHREQDALLRYTRDLLDGNCASRETLCRIDAEVTARARQACRFAMDSPYPAPAETFEHIFA
jgi:pyruvate dehydrogenase E1 component alpha subunit